VTFTTKPLNAYLDLSAYRGQRVERFTFKWINGVTGQNLGFVTPLRDSSPMLTHTTDQTIKRQLNLALGVADTARVNALTDRILPFVTIGGVTYPLGRYMFTGDTNAQSTGGDRGNFTLVDEGFIIDQQLESATSATGTINEVLLELMTPFKTITKKIEPSPFRTTTTFTAGQNRGQALDTYVTQGDYFPWWLDHNGDFRMIRIFDPATQPVTMDLDLNRRVIRDSPVEDSDILTAPNRFIVISNGGDVNSQPLTGKYDVPPSAPHSIAQRGFVIPDIRDMQLTTPAQAEAIARNVGLRATVFERVTLTTPIDPRHDSFDVIRWRGDNWLELAWSMELTPGGAMQHTLRKAYAP
jgi:hypothetical protein